MFGGGEDGLIEMMFVKNYRFVLDNIKQVAEVDAKGGLGYKNPDYSDCSYEDATMKHMEEAERANIHSWDTADPNKPQWGDEAWQA